MINIEIEGIERDCEIMSVPRGYFADYGETFGFPLYACICKAITEDEKSCGDVLVCPIECFNNGYEAANPAAITDSLALGAFQRYVDNFTDGFGWSVSEAFDYITNAFEKRGVLIENNVYSYIKDFKK